MSVPSVATKGATPSLLTTRPLTRPISSPTPIPASSPTQTSSGCPTTIDEAVIALTAITLPTDRSMPPVRMTKV